MRAAVKSSLEIRAFQDADLNFITQLARQEDFAPGVGDIAIYANTGNQGVWLAWQNDKPVGCIAAVKYNPDYGFIGLFVVHPDHRGRGVGKRLWEHALTSLADVTCIGLEAAPAMVEFYKREGFRRDSITTRRQHLCLEESSTHPSSRLLHRNDITVVPLGNISIDAVQAYDERHEISPRPHFLEQWLNHRAGDVFVAMDATQQCHGYVRIRPCLLPIGQGWRIGPLMAEEPGIASLLLSNAMDRHKGIILIDTPGHNRSARTVAGAKGFRRMGATHRMYRGSLDNGHDQNIYGLACLELG